MFKNIVKINCTKYFLVSRSFCNTNLLKNVEKSTKVEAEIAFFQNRADIWWNKSPLHAMNELRVPFVWKNLKKRGILYPDFADTSTPLENINIIDVGCGGGILSEALSELGANVTGIDASKDLIETAKEHCINNPLLKNKINYIYGAIEDIVSDNKNKFDAVVSSECIEHVAEQEMYLQSCIDVLKPGGSIFITTFNKTTSSWLIGIIFYEYISKSIPKGTHDWNKFISPQKVQKILEKNNCQTLEVRGLAYNFISKRWFWLSNTSVTYALHAVKNV